MLSGGMAGPVFASLSVKAFFVSKHGVRAPIIAGPRAFSCLSLWGMIARLSSVVSPLSSNRDIWLKSTGYTGPAPSSCLVNRLHGRLYNRIWVLAALLRR